MGSLAAVAFDKTGTLTAGRPVVTDFIIRAGVNAYDALSIIAGIESHSTHPLADAIIKYAKEIYNVNMVNPKTIENVVGFGVVGVILWKGIQSWQG